MRRLQETELLEHTAQAMHPPPVLALAPFGVVLGCPDPGVQLADLGMMGPVLAQERALAAGELRQLVLPALHFVLELGQGLTPGLFCRPASPAPAPPVPMLAAKPAHADPQGGDFFLGADERREGPVGAAGLSLGMEPGRGHVRQTLAQISQPAFEFLSRHNLLVLAE